MMNQISRFEAEPEALMALPNDTFPFSVYTVALTACAQLCHSGGTQRITCTYAASHWIFSITAKYLLGRYALICIQDSGGSMQ